MILTRNTAFAILSITIIACGGNGELSAAIPLYETPVQIPGTDEEALIEGVSPNGHLVGYKLPTSNLVGGESWYWENPISGPTILRNISNLICAPKAVNDAGQIVGHETSSTPIFWQSSNSIPTHLVLPEGQDRGRVNAINSLGLMVGETSGSQGSKAVAWNNPVSVVVLQYLDGASTKASHIIDSGTVYGSFTGNGFTRESPLSWPNTRSNGARLITSQLDHFYGVIENVNVRSGRATSTGFSNAAQNSFVGPFSWSTPSQISPLGFEIGFPAGISDDGVVAYNTYPYYNPPISKAMIAKSTSSAAVELKSLIPPGSTWNLQEANFILGDGSIIGRGQVTKSGVTRNVWYYAKRIK